MTTGLIPEMNLHIVNLYAPSGTRIPMNQTAPPLGWTQDTSAAFSDCSMRVVNTATGGATGGTTGWSGWNFGATLNVNAFTISTAQLPVHNHGINDPTHAHNDAGHTHNINPGAFTFQASAGSSTVFVQSGNTNVGTGFAQIQLASTGITTQNTGSGNSITPTYTTPQVKFTDHIMAVKS